MRLFNSKKGAVIELMLNSLYNLIIAVVVIFLFWNTLLPGGTSNIESEFWTKDVALSTTTIASTTGNLFVDLINRPKGDSPLNITFNFVKKGAIISTLNEKGITSRPLAFPYITKKSLKTEEAVIPLKHGDRSQIKITKIDNNMFIDYQKTEKNMNILNCPQTKIDALTNILIDYSQNTEDTVIAENIAFYLFDRLTPQPKITKEKSSTTKKSKTEIKKLIDQDDLAIISIHIGKNDDKTLHLNKNYDFIKAYISHKSKKRNQSEALACKILNSLSDSNKIDGVAIVPIIPEQFPEDDPRNEMLNNDKTAILLEIGNIENKEGIIKSNNLAKIGKSILTSIR
jgi:hypothetical protein